MTSGSSEIIGYHTLYGISRRPYDGICTGAWIWPLFTRPGLRLKQLWLKRYKKLQIALPASYK